MMVTTPKKLMCLKVTKKSMMKPSKDLVMLVATPLIFKMKGKSRFLTLTLKRTLAFILNFIQKFYLEDSSAIARTRLLTSKSALTPTK